MSGDADACPKGARRIAVLLEYDGTAYSGSQYQENGPTIQSAMETAVQRLTGETARVAFAGRTDAGVHAMGQVGAFDTQARLGTSEFVRGLNHFLSRDIAVLAAKDVEARFDPRRDANGRLYRYRIEARPVRPALRRDRVWQVARPLDVEAMRRTASRLEGAHDFAAFAPPFDGLTARTLRRCAVMAAETRVEVEMEAQAFLPHQVRRTVGALVEVGAGRMSEDALVALLEEARPSSLGPAAPPCGLYLVSVAYDGLDFGAGQGNGRDG